MRNKTFIALAVTLVMLIVGSVAVYAYDASKDGEIAEGVTVGGVDVGGMNANQARRAIQEQIEEPFRQPVVVEHEGRRFRLSSQTAELDAGVEAMVNDAIKRSREGNVITRSWRNVSGGEVDASLPARVSYSEEAVDKHVRRVKRELDRPAQDAGVDPSATGLSTHPGKNGLEVQTEPLRAAIIAKIERPTGDRTVAVETEETKPKVTEDEVAQKYPTYITIDRSNFKLRFYKNLKKVKTYPIAVGQVGFDTPVGVYPVENKAVDPAWHVPDAEWAGDLAGQVIPGGAPNNPLRARWMGIGEGRGIHGTDQPESIGTAASHGCIRMLIPDVTELYEDVPVATPVYIG